MTDSGPPAQPTHAYTPEEWAVKHRVCVETVYRQIRAGTLRAERIGRQYRIMRAVVTRQKATEDNTG